MHMYIYIIRLESLIRLINERCMIDSWFPFHWELYFESLHRKSCFYSGQPDGGGYRQAVGNLRQVEETSLSSRTAPWLDSWTGLGCRASSGGRCARSVRRGSSRCCCCCCCWTHTMIPHPKHASADFPILSLCTYAGHLNVDAGRTRDVVAMDNK